MKLTTARRAHGPAGGFTLIELMVAMAVMAILVAVAYPTYLEQVRKGRRAEAQAVLMEGTQFLERFATENMRYDQDRAGVAVALPAALRKAPKEGSSKFYDISLQSVSQNAYVLQAVPAGSNTGDACGTMTVSNTGAKTASTTTCWKR